MKLPIAARNELLKAIRNHPDIRQHVAHVADVNRFRKEQLIALGQRLGVDVERLIHGNRNASSGLEGAYKREESGLPQHSDRYPAFTGAIEFDLELSLFGTNLHHLARLVWKYTPEWEYFDIRHKKVMFGWAGSWMHFEVFVSPESERDENGVRRKIEPRPTWEKIDLVIEGLLPNELWDRLEEQIDSECHRIDAENRKRAGLPR